MSVITGLALIDPQALRVTQISTTLQSPRYPRLPKDPLDSSKLRLPLDPPKLIQDGFTCYITLIDCRHNML